MAAGVITIADKFGIRVPENLSIAGFDDLTLALFVCPSLTTIHQPVEDMAIAEVKRLREIRENSETG